MGKTSKIKAPLGDFKIITPENSLLSQQTITSKGISVPYTNLQLNLYPNTQLDLFCNDNLSFQCTASLHISYPTVNVIPINSSNVIIKHSSKSQINFGESSSLSPSVIKQLNLGHFLKLWLGKGLLVMLALVGNAITLVSIRF